MNEYLPVSSEYPAPCCPHCQQILELGGMSNFRDGDRVVVLRLDSDEIECHGCYAGESGPMMYVLIDDDDLPDPVAVGADRVLPEKRHHHAE